MLPHQFPFRLVEERPGEAVTIALTADATWWRGREGPPRALALEILAQAAIVLLPDEGDEPRRGLLAGVDRATFHRRLEPGERLAAQVALTGRFGRLSKVSGTLVGDGGEKVAEADLLLALEGD